MWRRYILLQYHASLTQIIEKEESYNFCIVYGKFEDFRTFQYIFEYILMRFCALRTIGKCTSRHLLSCGGFFWLHSFRS